MNLALGLSLALSLLVIFRGQLKKFNNVPALLLMGFAFVSALMAPKLGISLLGKEIGNFWMWKPLFFYSVFFLTLVSVTSINFTKEEIKLTFNIMAWIGFIMAIYCILQSMRLEQFYRVAVEIEATKYTPKHWIGGTLGHPTIVSPFIAMIIPIVIYLRKWIMAVGMFIAVILTSSQIGIGAMIVSLLFLIATKGRKYLICSVLFFVLVTGTFAVCYYKIPEVRSFACDSGRFDVWKLIVQDINEPISKEAENKYTYTGFGPGAYEYIFPLKHKSNMFQAHNDYLELGYNIGIIGFILFLSSIFYVWYKNFSLKAIWKGKVDKYRMTLLSSFLCILICAGGTFVFQLGAHIFYTIIIVGFLSKQGGRKCLRKY